MTSKKKIKFIINPVSGISNKDRIIGLIEQRLNKQQFDHQFVFTQYAGHGYELGCEAVQQGLDAVIVVGGDGSVNEVGKALVGTEVKLGIIPTGSGNGLAHFLKIPFNLGEAINALNAFHLKTIDTLTANGHFFCNAAGVGFDAKVAHEFAKVKRRGFWSYFKVILHEYPIFPARSFSLHYEGHHIQRKALLVSFANSDQFGNNAIIAPEAQVDDGLVDVCIMSRVPLIEAPLLGQMLLLKLINKTHWVEYIRTAEITIEQPGETIAHLDGEPVVLGEKIHIKVNPLSLQVIVPESVR